MALVVEDGTGSVAGANSYTDLVTIRAYGVARGYTLSADDGALTVQAIKAMDYLEAKEPEYRGDQSYPGVQPLAWPRTNVQINNTSCPTLYYDPSALPNNLIRAQCQLVCEQSRGTDIMPTVSEPFVKSEKISAAGIETVYDAASIAPLPSFPLVDSWLSPLLGASAGGVFAGFRTNRV